MHQSSQVIWCEFCFGTHHVGYCPEQVSPPLYQPYYPTEEEERTSRLEDTLVQFMEWSMINQRETKASIKRLQEQMGKLAEMQAEWRRNMVEAQREESDEEEEKSKKEERDPSLHPLPIPSISQEVNHEEEEVSFEDLDNISNHQCNDEILTVEHIDFVFGDEHVASISSKNCIFSFIHMHVNILACELNVGDLCWKEN